MTGLNAAIKNMKPAATNPPGAILRSQFFIAPDFQKPVALSSHLSGRTHNPQATSNETQEWSPREWSRWEASDMDGQTREGESSGKKTSQAVRHRWESRRPRSCG